MKHHNYLFARVADDLLEGEALDWGRQVLYTLLSLCETRDLERADV